MDGHTSLCIFDIHIAGVPLPQLKCPAGFPSMILRPRTALCVIPMVQLCPSEGTAENGWHLNKLIELETHGILSWINKPQSKFYQVNQVYQCDDQKLMVTLDVSHSWFTFRSTACILSPCFSPKLGLQWESGPASTRLHFQPSLASWSWGLSFLAIICLSYQTAEEAKTPQACWHAFILSPHLTCWVNLGVTCMHNWLGTHSRNPLQPWLTD